MREFENFVPPVIYECTICEELNMGIPCKLYYNPKTKEEFANAEKDYGLPTMCPYMEDVEATWRRIS